MVAGTGARVSLQGTSSGRRTNCAGARCAERDWIPQNEFPINGTGTPLSNFRHRVCLEPADAMYYVRVFYSGARVSHEEHKIERGSDVLSRIPEILASHPASEHLAVYIDTNFLFAVDCNGNRLADPAR